MTMVKFIDVSYYDPLVNWTRYDWDAVFIKVSEGLVQDKQFQTQWRAAQGSTIRGGYHFFRPSINPVKAAELFISYLGSDRGELPVVLDLEVDDRMGDGVPENALAWINRVVQLTGREPIIYTSRGFIGRVKLYNYPQFRRYKLWLAEYPRDKIEGTWTEENRRDWINNVLHSDTYKFPVPPSPFTDVTFVQFTGKCPPEYVPAYPLGTKLAVDVSFYKGDLSALIKEFGITLIPTKEGEPYMDTTVTMTADLKSLQPSNLRPNPGLQAGLIRTLVGPLHIECVGQKVFKDNYWWSEVIRIGGEEEQGWIAWTTAYENVKVVSTGGTPRKVVRTTLFYDDGSTQDLP